MNNLSCSKHVNLSFLNSLPQKGITKQILSVPLLFVFLLKTPELALGTYFYYAV